MTIINFESLQVDMADIYEKYRHLSNEELGKKVQMVLIRYGAITAEEQMRLMGYLSAYSCGKNK